MSKIIDEATTPGHDVRLHLLIVPFEAKCGADFAKLEYDLRGKGVPVHPMHCIPQAITDVCKHHIGEEHITYYSSKAPNNERIVYDNDLKSVDSVRLRIAQLRDTNVSGFGHSCLPPVVCIHWLTLARYFAVDKVTQLISKPGANQVKIRCLCGLEDVLMKGPEFVYTHVIHCGRNPYKIGTTTVSILKIFR